MTQLLRGVSFDLDVEQNGHRCHISGTGELATVTFSSLSALTHFARFFWPLRHELPQGMTVVASWRTHTFSIRGSKPIPPPWNA
jgi:hypothetical protein